MESYLRNKENYLESKIRRTKSNKEKFLLYSEYQSLLGIIEDEFGLYVEPKIAITDNLDDKYQISKMKFYNNMINNLKYKTSCKKSQRNILQN